MAVCDYCNQEMLSARGCIETPITMLDGVVFHPVRYGDETDWPDPGERCGDCGVHLGAVHHHGCDIEECPRCRHQAISCGCLWKGEAHMVEDWEDEWEARLSL